LFALLAVIFIFFESPLPTFSIPSLLPLSCFSLFPMFAHLLLIFLSCLFLSFPSLPDVPVSIIPPLHLSFSQRLGKKRQPIFTFNPCPLFIFFPSFRFSFSLPIVFFSIPQAHLCPRHVRKMGKRERKKKVLHPLVGNNQEISKHSRFAIGLNEWTALLIFFLTSYLSDSLPLCLL